MLPAIALLVTGLTLGCLSPRTRLDSNLPQGAIEVVLDCNARTTYPGRPVKFFVDIVNETPHEITLDDVEIDINVHPRREPARVALTKHWTFRWRQSTSLGAGKKLTLPIRPEITSFSSGRHDVSERRRTYRLHASDFPIEQLERGEYLLRAIVNERHVSQPYQMTVSERPQGAGPITPTRRLRTHKRLHRPPRRAPEIRAFHPTRG